MTVGTSLQRSSDDERPSDKAAIAAGPTLHLRMPLHERVQRRRPERGPDRRGAADSHGAHPQPQDALQQIIGRHVAERGCHDLRPHGGIRNGNDEVGSGRISRGGRNSVEPFRGQSHSCTKPRAFFSGKGSQHWSEISAPPEPEPAGLHMHPPFPTDENTFPQRQTETSSRPDTTPTGDCHRSAEDLTPWTCSRAPGIASTHYISRRRRWHPRFTTSKCRRVALDPPSP